MFTEWFLADGILLLLASASALLLLIRSRVLVEDSAVLNLVGAATDLDFCYGNVDASYQDCQSWCPYDYYFGNWNTLQDCYNSCTDGANEGDRACVTEYNSEISSCDSDQQSGHQDCSDNYDSCVMHCPA